MESERTRKAGSFVLALLVIGMVGLGAAPSAQATEDFDVTATEDSGPCIKIYTDPPDVAISPENCPVVSEVTEPR